jgi:hypothetical protein
MKNKIIIASFVLFLPTQILAAGFAKFLESAGSDLVKAGTLSEKDVISQSRAAVKTMDSSKSSDNASAKYTTRLNNIVSRVELPKIKGVDFKAKRQGLMI